MHFAARIALDILYHNCFTVMIPQKQSLQGYHRPLQAAAMHFAARIVLDIWYNNCFTVMIPQKQSLQGYHRPLQGGSDAFCSADRLGHMV